MSKETFHLNISGMSCVNCSKGIKRAVDAEDGVENSRVSFASSEGVFEIDTQKISKKKIIEEIQKLGYQVQEDYDHLQELEKESFNILKRVFSVSISLTVVIFILAFSDIVNEDIKKYIIFFIASIVQFYCGARFYKLSFKSIANKNYDMNVLVALGTSAAYFYSTFVVFLPQVFPEHLRFLYFDGAAVIISFVLLGRFLEERSKQKASDFLKKLLDLAPNRANKILDNGDIEDIDVKALNIGDRILVKTGEKIATDAKIIDGKADIDTAMITGESMPVFKQKGDEVLAGTINTNGVITLEVLKDSKDTTLAKIIDLLKSAQSKAIPISRFADKISNIFVPSVIFISILTFIVWSFLGDMQNAILASISVLIISCPCALGLATPIAIVSSVSRGAKEGILIKNPEILEVIKDIKYAVFDKTGTLTKGEISVKDTDIDKIHYAIISSIEKLSEHPISKAIVKYMDEKNIKSNNIIDEIDIIAGKGIKAYCEGSIYLLGNKKLLEDHNTQILDIHQKYHQNELENLNGVIYVAKDGKTLGSFSLEDRLKDEAVELIGILKSKNIEPILLTGDNQLTAKSVADKLGIKKIYSEVLPTQKYDVIKSIQNDGKVMFVGDGINDAPSIKQADIGITLNSGADISKDAGDIILVNNHLLSVIKSINLSVESMKIVKQNLFWAFAYNTLGIPLAAGVLYPFFGFMLTPMYAGMAMSLSSVTVVLNSLRLKIKKL